MGATISFTAMSQNKGHGKGKSKHEKHENNNDQNDHNYGNNEDRNDNEDRNNGNGGKYSKNLPSQVAASFNRDYPGATNVSWTKSRGVWTASFNNGILRNRVSYAANGQQVGVNSTNTSTYPAPNGIPSRVSTAFYRDFPNATNVSWTNNLSKIWTATFRTGLLKRTASYNANGQRL